MTSEAVVTTRGLTKRYGSVVAVADLDLEVRKGEIYAFLGRNGAGKTTTIRMILGLIRPDAGEVRVFGVAKARAPNWADFGARSYGTWAIEVPYGATTKRPVNAMPEEVRTVT